MAYLPLEATDPSELTIFSSTQSLGEYHLTKSSKTHPGLAACSKITKLPSMRLDNIVPEYLKVKLQE